MDDTHSYVASKVKPCGKDKWGNTCFRFGETGRRYCGRGAYKKALKQGYAILKLK